MIMLKETLRSLTDIEKILIVDVETTGLKKDSEIIQFSAIGYHLFPNGSIREEERINYYIKKKKKIPIIRAIMINKIIMAKILTLSVIFIVTPVLR